MAMAPVENEQEQAQDQTEQAQGGGVQEMVNSIGNGLMKLQKLFAQSPELAGEAEIAGQLLEGVKQMVSMLEGGGQPAPGGQGVTTPEAGAAQVKPAL